MNGRSQRGAVPSWITLLICSVGAIITANAQSPDAANPPSAAEVVQQVALLNNEIHQIRSYLGVRLPRSRDFRISKVQPRQVYTQAQSLFRKTNQLAREIAGVSRQAPPGVPDRDISVADVFALIADSRRQLDVVRLALGITEPVEQPKLQRRRDMSDAMRDLVLTMDVLNQLIHQRPDWPDIYERLLLVISYTGGLLPESARYPELPPHQCCKMPQDVIEILLEAMEMTRPAANKAGMTITLVESMKAEEGGASTDTVYDLANTLIADIAELSLRMDGEDVAPPDYPQPVRIFPSHAYQLALVFRTQVAQLVR